MGWRYIYTYYYMKTIIKWTLHGSVSIDQLGRSLDGFASFPNSSFELSVGFLHVDPTKSFTFSPGDLSFAMLL